MIWRIFPISANNLLDLQMYNSPLHTQLVTDWLLINLRAQLLNILIAVKILPGNEINEILYIVNSATGTKCLV